MSSLKKYEMEETGVLHLRDAGGELMYADKPDGEPDLAKPMRVHVHGPGSKQYEDAMNAKQIHNMELLKGRGDAKDTFDEALKRQLKFLAECTRSFENIDSDSGNTGAALVAEVYANRKLSFIRDQVGGYLNATANFTKASSKRSASSSGTAPG